MRHSLLSCVALLVLGSSAVGQWSCDPAVASPSEPAIQDVLTNRSGLASDDSLFVAGLALDGTSAIQRLDAAGFTLWPAPIVLSPSPFSSLLDLHVDSQGRALITFADERGLLVQRIDAAGNQLFAAQGQIVAPPGGSPWSAGLRELPGGDFAIVFSVAQTLTSSILRYQRLAPDGTPRLSPGGVLLATNTPRAKLPQLHVAVGGDLLVAWYRDGIPTAQRALEARRFSAVDGGPVWPDVTTVFQLLTVPNSGLPLNKWTSASNGAGGLTFAWWSYNPDPLVQIQTVESTGALRFAGTGITVWQGGEDVVPPALLVDATTGTATVFFLQSLVAPASAILAARFAADGTALWGFYMQPFKVPLTVVSGSEVRPWRLRAAEHGDGFVLAWSDLDSNDAYVQRVNEIGAPVWSEPMRASASWSWTRGLHATADGTTIATGSGVFGVEADGNLGGTPLEITCSPSTTSLGCVPEIGTVGNLAAGSPGSFLITASQIVSQSPGLFFYGLQGPASIPFGSGTLCAQPPLRRTPLIFSGGSPQLDCTGAFVFDFKGWLLAGNDPNLMPGSTVHGQFQFRDAQSTAGFGTTAAVEFYACP